MNRVPVYTIIAMLVLILFPSSVYGTHLSKPIITINKIDFKSNETIPITGWIDYFGLPASGVLADIIVKSPDGYQILRKLVRSDTSGNFSYNLALPKSSPSGAYKVKVISECKDEHREICENKSSTLIINVTNKNSKFIGTSHITRSLRKPFVLPSFAQAASFVILPNNTVTRTSRILDEKPLCNKPTIVGSPENKVIKGTGGKDIISTGNGNHVVDGLGGSDIICIGNGNNTVYGGPGSDIIYGGSGNNLIDGGLGNDTIFGGLGNDLIYGDEGNDHMYGGLGNDTIFGGLGNDLIYGGNGSGILYGGLGNDVLYGGYGNYTIHGDPGDDVIYGGPGNNELYGGPGYNIIYGGKGFDRCFEADIYYDCRISK